VAKGDTVVAYCHVGMQASVLYVAARLLGYEAAVYDGSFEDWSRRTDLPVSRGAVVTQRAIVR
jgi:thiosulfate/3-mercaptopyruvate sulfurtransferase